MTAKAKLVESDKRHQSKAGYWFAESDPTWELDKNIKVKVSTVRDALSVEARGGFTATLTHYARTMSAGHTKYMADALLMMLRTVASSSINVTTLINYRSTLRRDTEHRLGSVRGFIYKWHDLGYPGVSDDAVDLLNTWTLKGAIRGDAVKRLDPTQGPLTDNELLAFNEGAVCAFERDLILMIDLSLSLLISNTGRRPIQPTHNKICDLDGTHRNKKGEPMYLIHIPRAKQRAGSFRASFKTFAMTQELWAVLNAQKQSCIQLVEQRLGYALPESDRLTLPLFPDLSAFKPGTPVTQLRRLLRTDHLHLKSSTVTEILQKVGSVSQCHSERTGDLLVITARRFRYTIGTRAAREGLGLMIIAELLDHTDIQNAVVYTVNVPEHAAVLDKKLSSLMAPYAKAFQGVIVDNEQAAQRGEDPCSRIRFHNEGTGTCGAYGFCGANVPIPCYTCMHFQPWIDAPHEIIHDHLLAERIRVLEVTGDAAVAAANDRTILAVAQVIQRCHARREELAQKECE